LEYSTDDSSWNSFGASPQHWNYANGADTEGGATTYGLVSDSNANGVFIETADYQTILTKSTVEEFDWAIAPTSAVSAETTYYFRVLYSTTTEVPLEGAHSHPQVLTTTAGTDYPWPPDETGYGTNLDSASELSYALDAQGGNNEGGAWLSYGGVSTLYLDIDPDSLRAPWAATEVSEQGTYTADVTGAGTDYPWPPDETGYGTDEEVIPYAEFASSRNRVGSAVCAAAVAAVIAFSPVPSTGAAVTISAGADFENATAITADVAGTLSADHELEVAVYPDAGATEVVSAGADLRIAVVTEGDVTGSFEVSEQGTYEADVAGAGTDYPWPPDDTGYGINGEISTGAEVGGSLVAPADVAVTISTGADLAQTREYEGDAIGYIDVGEGTYTASVDEGEGEDNDLRFIIWYRSDRQ
jgi:hypothetical protein